MRYLVDTHLILWAAIQPDDLPAKAADIMEDLRHQLSFSVVNLWEVVIKNARTRVDFEANPYDLRAGMLANGYLELTVSASHVLAVGDLPYIHRDPFDRLLIAQARVEGLTLLTADATVARYPGAILHV